MDDARPYLTVSEVAERLDRNVHSIYRAITSGELRATRVKVRNNQWRITEDDLNEYLKGRTSDMMSIPQVAIMLGFSGETVRRMCSEGKLSHVRGAGRTGHFRVPRAAVESYLAETR